MQPWVMVQCPGASLVQLVGILHGGSKQLKQLKFPYPHLGVGQQERSSESLPPSQGGFSPLLGVYTLLDQRQFRRQCGLFQSVTQVSMMNLLPSAQRAGASWAGWSPAIPFELL